MGSSSGKASVVALWVILGLCVAGIAGWYFAVPEGTKATITDSIAAIRQRFGGDSSDIEQAAPLRTEPPMASPQETVGKPEFPGQTATSPATPSSPASPTEGAVTPAPEATPVSRSGSEDGTPESVLKACAEKLKENDVIGAEEYVTENGMKFTVGTTVGIHEILWKGLYKLHAYDEIGYDEATVAGQTAWIPLYTRLGRTRMVTMLVMANRGDGWKLDHLCDAKKF